MSDGERFINNYVAFGLLVVIFRPQPPVAFALCLRESRPVR
jgi:hypothetical protein